MMSKKYSERFHSMPKWKGLLEDVVFSTKVSETPRSGTPGVLINPALRG
jgi:hypothetical protein